MTAEEAAQAAKLTEAAREQFERARQHEAETANALVELLERIEVRLAKLEARPAVNTYTSSTLPAASTVPGAVIFNSTTSKHQGSDGTTWSDLY